MTTYRLITDNRPALIGLQLSPTFIPGLNRATDLLRLAYPDASDAELLERIFVAGICATVDQFTTQPGARPLLRSVDHATEKEEG